MFSKNRRYQVQQKKILGGREKVKVALVQAAPVFMDKERTIEKACRLIREAGGNGAELVVFPEVYIPAYPAAYTTGWESKPSEWAAFMIALQDNSILVDSSDTEILGEAAREANAYAVIGCNELDDRPGSRTVYNTLLFIGRDGKLMGRHRKLMPTYTERTYWGRGDASDLRVFDTDIGRIGGLICGENLMVLLKAAMMQSGEEFHIMVWPGALGGHSREHIMAPETDSILGNPVFSTVSSYAGDAQAFVLSCGGILRPSDFPEEWQYVRDSDHANYSYAVGGSTVANPHGRFIAGPIIGEETILYADCHAYQIKLAKAIMDCMGHYTRWDAVRLQVSEESLAPETEMLRKPIKLPAPELRRMADKHGIGIDKLESVIEELNSLLST